MRTRLLHPGLAKHEQLAELSPVHRLLFAMLPMLLDRQGRAEDRPRRIKAELFPYDTDKEAPVDALLQDLHDAGFIQRYEVDGARYLCVRTFAKWQRPHPREAKSEIPPPPEQGKPRHDPGVSKATPRLPVFDLDPVSDPVSRDLAESPKQPGLPAVLSPLAQFLTSEWSDLTPERAAALEASHRASCPGVDLLAEARKARAWEIANPTLAKRNHGRFLGSWWSRAQDELGKGRGATHRPGAASVRVAAHAYDPADPFGGLVK